MEFKKLGWFWLRQDECEFCRRIRNLLAAIVGFTMFLVFGPRYAFLLGIHFTTFFAGILGTACIVLFFIKLKREARIDKSLKR
jgi:hypothetical protein